MKKLSLFLIASIMSVVCLMSCIEGNNVQEGHGFGVLQYSPVSYTPMLNSTVGPYSSPTIGGLISKGDMSIDNCYYFYYSLDLDLPENSYASVQANGYYTVSLLDVKDIPTFYLRPYLTDTSTMMFGEMALYDGYESGNAYVDEYYFAAHIVNQPTTLELDWDLSYNSSDMQSVDASGRSYNLYIRAVKKNTTEKTNNELVQHVNAYMIRDFMKTAARMERNALGGNYSESSSRLNIRFNYVSDISEDGKLTWSSKKEENIYVGAFLSDDY